MIRVLDTTRIRYINTFILKIIGYTIRNRYVIYEY